MSARTYRESIAFLRMVAEASPKPIGPPKPVWCCLCKGTGVKSIGDGKTAPCSRRADCGDNTPSANTPSA